MERKFHRSYFVRSLVLALSKLHSLTKVKVRVKTDVLVFSSLYSESGSYLYSSTVLVHKCLRVDATHLL